MPPVGADSDAVDTVDDANIPGRASSVSVPPEGEKTPKLMRNHEKRNSRSDGIAGKCWQVRGRG